MKIKMSRFPNENKNVVCAAIIECNFERDDLVVDLQLELRSFLFLTRSLGATLRKRRSRS
jgi:hypothetical protein